MTTSTDLYLPALARVHSLPQRAVWPLLDLIAAHLREHGSLDRAAFLRLADEAEAVAVR